MAYHTTLYLILFLPILLFLYQLTPKKYRYLTLLAGCYYFYFSISGGLIVYLLAVTLIVHDIGLWIEAERAGCQEQTEGIKEEERLRIGELSRARHKKIFLFGILVLLGILLWKKYYNFAAVNGNRLLELFSMEKSFQIKTIAVPIGLSFFSLQAVGYLTDVWERKIRAERHLGRLALFLAFFPQIMEGPICRYEQTAGRLCEGTPLTMGNLTFGSQRILWGLLKKMLAADRLHVLVNNVYGNYQSYDGTVIAVAAVAYTAQLYLEFSGCMDMALGSAELFGVILPENFRRPFFSKSVAEFWRRWHITLGTWFKDYIFYPVSMSDWVRRIRRKDRLKGNPYLQKMCVSAAALFPVWFCNGLWHGPRWSYMFFGMYYFVLILLSTALQPWNERLCAMLHIRPSNRIYQLFQILRTFVLVVIGELFFRAAGLKIGIDMFLSVLTRFRLSSLWDGTLLGLGLDIWDFRIIALTVAAVVLVSCLQERGIAVRKLTASLPPRIKWCIYYGGMIALCLFGAYGTGYSPVDLIYANF